LFALSIFTEVLPARHFDDSLRTINPATLLPAFDSLVQNLFKNATHSATSASLTMAIHSQCASLLRARGSDGLTAQDERLLRQMPTDIRTIYKMFRLDPQDTLFAACTKSTCCAIYAPTLDKMTGIPYYPPVCVREKFGRKCGLPLVKQRVCEELSVSSPIRPFTYRHFNDHVASRLSQPGIEKAIESHRQNTNGLGGADIYDIVDSHYILDLKDPDGLPFLRTYGTELRLVWALCLDWYNPYHNKAAGKKVSSGVVALICLSLPLEMRLQAENIFHYTIPGPQEPSVDATNQFVDHF
jgi:hypothetical protein